MGRQQMVSFRVEYEHNWTFIERIRTHSGLDLGKSGGAALLSELLRRPMYWVQKAATPMVLQPLHGTAASLEYIDISKRRRRSNYYYVEERSTGLAR